MPIEATLNSIRIMLGRIRGNTNFLKYIYNKFGKKNNEAKEVVSKEEIEKTKSKKAVVGSFFKKVPSALFDFFTSPTFGLILSVAGAFAMLASPFGIVFGGIMCGVTLAGISVALVRKTQRMRTLNNLKKQDLALTNIKELSEEHGKILPQELQNISQEITANLKQDIKDSLQKKSTSEEQSKFKNFISNISRKMRYVDATGTVSGIAATLPSIISGNPTSTILFAWGLATGSYMTYDNEKNFRRNKDKFLGMINHKKDDISHYLEESFDLTKEQVHQLGLKELQLIENHTKAEAHALNAVSELSKEEQQDVKKIQDIYLSTYKASLEENKSMNKENSLLYDMGRVVVHGVSAKKGGKLFSIPAAQEAKRKIQQKKVIELQRFYRNKTVNQERMSVKKKYDPPVQQKERSRSHSCIHEIFGPHTGEIEHEKQMKRRERSVSINYK